MTEHGKGVVYALLAYTAWGIGPLLWKQLLHVPSPVILAHRVVWASALLLALVVFRGRLGELRLLREPRQALFLATTAALLAFNWFIYIHAVNTGAILQASLGYFINPLVNIFLGLVVLGERLRRVQWIAVALAALAIAIQLPGEAGVPWLALALAFSFGIYGLMRKVARADGLLGTAVETTLMLAPALAFLALASQPVGATNGGAPAATTSLLLLFLGGVQTALPLLWFSNAARRLPFSTLGFFQYIAPSCQFVLATVVYGETLETVQMLSFGLIWSGLVLLGLDARLGTPRTVPAESPSS